MVDLKEIQNQLTALGDEYRKKEEALLAQLSKKDRLKTFRPVRALLTIENFTANGTKYVFRETLAISRFERFEELQPRVGFGVSFEEIFGNQRRAFDMLNEGKAADAAVVLYNSMNGIKEHLEGRENAVLELCALFICREGENIATYDPVLTKAKIADWRAEGIAMNSFFDIAFDLVQGFTPAYSQVSQSISTEVEKAKSKARSTRT